MLSTSGRVIRLMVWLPRSGLVQRLLCNSSQTITSPAIRVARDCLGTDQLLHAAARSCTQLPEAMLGSRLLPGVERKCCAP